VYINFILCANLLPVATHAGHEELAMVEVRYTAMLTRVLRVLIIALLCVGVFLQILGAAVAFWDVDGSDDPFMSSILTSFAVLGNESVFLVLLQCLFGVAMITVSYQQLRQDTLFHPPLS
jgi:hypothetical protein